MKYWKLGVLCICAVVVLLTFSILKSNGDESLIVLKTQNEYLFDIGIPRHWEYSQPVYCQVMKDEKTIFPLDMIGATNDSNALEFELIEDESAHLIAIVEKAAPHVILAIYDVKNLQSWPSSDPKIEREDERKLGEELLQRLNKSNSGEPFILRSNVPGGTKLKIR